MAFNTLKQLRRHAREYGISIRKAQRPTGQNRYDVWFKGSDGEELAVMKNLDIDRVYCYIHGVSLGYGIGVNSERG